jgi:TolB-like protein/Tfp pilus assembly protein PilF
MPEPLRPIALPRQSEAKDRLESWKEIAAYLGREVRTVQGWEKNEGLPVHRHQHARQGSVYAFRVELDAWRQARKSEETPPPPVRAVTGRERSKGLFWAGICTAAVLVLAAVFFTWKWVRERADNTLASVVVLPFLDLSPQKDQEYFSDGLTEEIIDALTRVPNLRVVSRTSAFAFKGKPADIREIGRQLNVSAVLEGSVRKAGDQLRITAQLNRVSDGTHLWSRTFDRQLHDIFAVQQEISQSIAGRLRAGPVAERPPTENLEAYRLFQEGRYLFNQHLPPDSYRKAIERYQQAIQLDPRFALAYAAMADAYAYLAENFVAAPREEMPKAKQAAEKAVSLDDNLSEAHTSMGIVKMDYDWDRDGARKEFLKAMQLNPGSGYVHHWYAHSLEAQGRLEEAMKEMRAALDLDPLSLVIRWDIALELISTKRYGEAVANLKKSLELFPNQPILLTLEAVAYYDKGDLAMGHGTIEAMKAAAAADGMSGDPYIIIFVAWAAAKEGRRAEAEQGLAELERMHRTQYIEPFLVTWLCSALGDKQNLELWVKRGIAERSTQFLYVPLWKDMYNTPEVQDLLSQAAAPAR